MQWSREEAQRAYEVAVRQSAVARGLDPDEQVRRHRQVQDQADVDRLIADGVKKINAKLAKKPYVAPQIDRMTDAEAGVSMRFVREYNVEAAQIRMDDNRARAMIDKWTHDHWRMSITSDDERMLQERGISPA